ncbi:MAG: hypothetical protein FWB72_03845 [Firmicutes bacterium]|nr:hypothetical protein [Bacillota bacterium]
MNPRTKKITISAVLSSLSFVYIFFMPTIDLGVWSFTPFSHLPLFVAAFISPYTALMTYLAVLLGFIASTPNPLVWLRAGSHIVFVVFLCLYVKYRGVKTTRDIIFLAISTAILHAVFEIIAVLIGLAVGFTVNTADYHLVLFIVLVLGLGTVGHNTIDFFGARFVLNVTKIEVALEPTTKYRTKEENQTGDKHDVSDHLLESVTAPENTTAPEATTADNIFEEDNL